MGFRKLRIAPINSWVSADGYPSYGPFVKLQDADISNELNSVDISVSNVVKEKTYAADDKEEINKVIVRAEGTLKVYDVRAEVARSMFGHTVDVNGNTIEVVNSSEKSRYGAFFEGKTAKDVRYQKYLYDLEFEEPTFTAATEGGTDVSSLEIPFKVKFIVDGTTGKTVKSATVYEGNPGWVLAEPTVMYKGAEVTGNLIPLSAPVISIDEANKITWPAVLNATGYVVIVNGAAQPAQTELSFNTLAEAGSYSIHVVAKGDGTTFKDSGNSNVVYYTIA